MLSVLEVGIPESAAITSASMSSNSSVCVFAAPAPRRLPCFDFLGILHCVFCRENVADSATK
jgi:hypothetical protein